MINIIIVTSISLMCLIVLWVVGAVAEWAERNAYDRRRRTVNKQYDQPEQTPFWFGDPPDGDTFP